VVGVGEGRNNGERENDRPRKIQIVQKVQARKEKKRERRGKRGLTLRTPISMGRRATDLDPKEGKSNGLRGGVEEKHNAYCNFWTGGVEKPSCWKRHT